MKMAAGSQQGVVPSSISAFAPYQNLPGVSGQTGTSDMSGLRHPSPNMPIESRYTEPNLLARTDFPQPYPSIYQAAQIPSNYTQQVYQQGRGHTAGLDIQGQGQNMINSPYQEMQLQQNQGHQMKLVSERYQ